MDGVQNEGEMDGTDWEHPFPLLGGLPANSVSSVSSRGAVPTLLPPEHLEY